jgi:hypothetical protein
MFSWLAFLVSVFSIGLFAVNLPVGFVLFFGDGRLFFFGYLSVGTSLVLHLAQPACLVFADAC